MENRRPGGSAKSLRQTPVDLLDDPDDKVAVLIHCSKVVFENLKGPLCKLGIVAFEPKSPEFALLVRNDLLGFIDMPIGEPKLMHFEIAVHGSISLAFGRKPANSASKFRRTRIRSIRLIVRADQPYTRPTILSLKFDGTIELVKGKPLRRLRDANHTDPPAARESAKETDPIQTDSPDGRMRSICTSPLARTGPFRQPFACAQTEISRANSSLLVRSRFPDKNISLSFFPNWMITSVVPPR